MKVFFSDFAVGAYQSDALFVVRTRPVIDMTATLTISPSPIPLSSEGLECSSQSDKNPCVTLTICFTYNGTAVPSATSMYMEVCSKHSHTCPGGHLY